MIVHLFFVVWSSSTMYRFFDRDMNVIPPNLFTPSLSWFYSFYHERNEGMCHSHDYPNIPPIFVICEREEKSCA